MLTSSPASHLRASAVLVSAIVLCFLILWGGQQLAGLVLSATAAEQSDLRLPVAA